MQRGRACFVLDSSKQAQSHRPLVVSNLDNKEAGDVQHNGLFGDVSDFENRHGNRSTQQPAESRVSDVLARRMAQRGALYTSVSENVLLDPGY